MALAAWSVPALTTVGMDCAFAEAPAESGVDVPPVSELGTLVDAFKHDPRGPYQGIRWFCTDGRINPARQPCGEEGSHQHALHKDVVQAIADVHGIYLGQILAGLPFEDFLDRENHFSRMQQYQLEAYLRAIDDGWVLRLAQHYRGAFQAEDEHEWGRDFLQWLLADSEMVRSEFFLLRETTRGLPHLGDEPRLDRIRRVSKAIAESYPEFMDVRVKLHSLPGPEDVATVRDFRLAHEAELSESLRGQFDQLEEDLRRVYEEDSLERLQRFLEDLPESSPVAEALRSFQAESASATGGSTQGTGGESARSIKRCENLANLLWQIRLELLDSESESDRLTLMDLSIQTELVLFEIVSSFRPQTLREAMEVVHALSEAAAGCGFLEIWEWKSIESDLTTHENAAALPSTTLADFLDRAFRALQWGTAMASAVHGPVIERFGVFEPMAHGFLDDRVRGSVLLPLGRVVDRLVEISAAVNGVQHEILDLPHPSVRGLNPGFAVGELAIVLGNVQEIEFTTDKIYVLSRPPADLEPVAGILSISEGNLVSHVQLLARNLGIPNVVLTMETLQDLVPYGGQRVFLSVSPRGAVHMRLASEMTTEERALFRDEDAEGRITIPIDDLDLEETRVLDIRALQATDSGRICGPKAANLGVLAQLFPDNVSAGLVIPFGVFRRHLDQLVPGRDITYWGLLEETFAERPAAEGPPGAESPAPSESSSSTEPVAPTRIERLRELHERVESMPLLPQFEAELESRFAEVMGRPLGEQAVFVRSDTNMEDLGEFTGAGLNLTVPNVLGREEILQAIRDVWASPFTERSYRWRQAYLSNAENVFPSVLFQVGVNASKSGVLITQDLDSGDLESSTVAFDRGVGGAVEGQLAETHLLSDEGVRLLSPSRERRTHGLHPEGGILTTTNALDESVLSARELDQLRQTAASIRRELPNVRGWTAQAPFDIELGFTEDGKRWLFQVRPFVESEQARTSTYLLGLDPPRIPPRSVDLDQLLEALMEYDR